MSRPTARGSVHRTGTGGVGVFRHLGDGDSFGAPELLADRADAGRRSPAQSPGS
jgi:hypothetical protein